MSHQAPDRGFMRPPAAATEVECMHCSRRYSSADIRWVPASLEKPERGFWRCPTDGCEGTGFLFDIWPTDPNYRDEHGCPVFYRGEDDPQDGPRIIDHL